MSSKYPVYLLVAIHVTSLSAFPKLSPSPGLTLAPKLDAPESLVEFLAESVCYDLEFYRKEVSHENCMKNFLQPHEVQSGVPPSLHVRCRRRSKIVYSVDYLGEGKPLVVLTTDNDTLLNLPYSFPTTPNEEFSTIDFDPGSYKSWITILNDDGTHSHWRRGPDVVSFNVTGDIRPREYSIYLDTKYRAVNEHSEVEAKFTWNSYDDEDVCFDFVNHCDGRSTEKSIPPSMKQTFVVSGLPLRTNCTVTLTGKYGTTRFAYQTRSCRNYPQCLEYEKAHNITVLATAGATTGWDVAVGWARPRNRPIRYNVTLFIYGELIDSVVVPGNETSTTFVGVEGDGEYDVAVGSVYERRTAYTSVGAMFPDPEKVNRLNVTATAGDSGWDVTVRWTAPRPRPRSYNVTLLTQHLSRSIDVPWNETSATFLGVEDDGYYDVAVGAVYESRTLYANIEAIFPEAERASALGTVVGGSWSALLALAAALGALLLLWRRRQQTRKGPYFTEPEDKLPKEGISEPVESESGAEDAWEVRPDRLLLHEVVGEGAFGVVRRATLAPHGKEVAVKMLKDFPTLDEIRSFRAEMELMKSVGAHPHIVSLVGCCSGRRPLIVAEYCARGDLLSYLRCSWDVMVSKRNVKYYNNNIDSSDYRNDLFKCKPQEEHSKLVVNKLYDLQGICDTELTTRDLLSFCRQIAMGMEFLASNRLVHRDLAARNVLVASDRTLKITDFGLSRDIYEENQYKQKGNGKMPMKWMAPESLTHRIYTTKSDVWSFGVVMWEVGSVGGSPFAGVAGARLPRLLRAGYRMPRPHHCPPALWSFGVVWEVGSVGGSPFAGVAGARLSRLLRAGYRMPRPHHCPPALYELMLSCWSAQPRSRPTFTELHARLDELLNSACAGHYLRLDLSAPDLAPPPPRNYVRMLIKSKLGWGRGETYERPLRAMQSNHYSSPPAPLVRAPVS